MDWPSLSFLGMSGILFLQFQFILNLTFVYVIFNCLAFLAQFFDRIFFLPKSHESLAVELFFILFHAHQAFIGLFLFFVDVRSKLRKSDVLPHRFVFVGERFLNYHVDVFSVSGIKPQLYFSCCQYDRHSVMNLGKIRYCILREDNYLVFFRVEPSHKKMVCVLGAETERLLFRLPLVVALHNHHASVLDVLEEGLFRSELLNPAVDDHVEVRFLPPSHESQLSACFILFFLSLVRALQLLWFILIQSFLNSLIQWLRFFCWFCWICGFVTVDFAALDDRNVCRWAHIIGDGVKLLVTSSGSSGNSQQPAERESLKQTTAHFAIPIYTYYLRSTSTSILMKQIPAIQLFLVPAASTRHKQTKRMVGGKARNS